jgi:outer membrane lipoprotein-sorting protein
MFKVHRRPGSEDESNGGSGSTEPSKEQLKEFENLFEANRRDVTLDPGFKEKLREQLLSQVPDQEKRWAKRARRRSLTFRFAAAAAVLIVVAMAGWLILGGPISTASASFAEMLKKVRQATTVTYDVTYAAVQPPENHAHISMAIPKKIRTEWPSGKIQIHDYEKRRILALYPSDRKAILGPMISSTIQTGEPLLCLQQLGDSAGRLISREKLNSRQVEVYEAKQNQQIMRIWVDVKEQLPARVEVRSTGPSSQAPTMVLDHFQWNAPIADSKFSLEAPPGYALEGPEDMTPEQLLAVLLKTSAAYSNGFFPANLNAQTVLEMLQKDAPASFLGSASFRPGSVEQRNLFRTCLWGLDFIEEMQSNGSWRYFGGAKLGDEKAIVCWWKPPGAAKYKVMFGDLKIKEVSQDQLPQPSTRPTTTKEH